MNDADKEFIYETVAQTVGGMVAGMLSGLEGVSEDSAKDNVPYQSGQRIAASIRTLTRGSLQDALSRHRLDSHY